MQHDERGIKSVELGTALFVIALVAAIAIPVFRAASQSAEGVAARFAERNEQTLAEAGESAGVVPGVTLIDAIGPAEVAGVALERSVDGALCTFRGSPDGVWYATWQSPTLTLTGVFSERPKECPSRADAEAAGFGRG